MHTFEHAIQGIDGSVAHLTGYLIENSPEIDAERLRPVVVVVPGGGYEFTSDREADPIAVAILGKGYHAFVLRYSVHPSMFPTALVELAQTVQIIRLHAAQWHVDPEAIIIAGFSAGGHLCASLGTGAGDKELIEYDIDPVQAHPNGMMLAYPVISTGQFAHRRSFSALLGDDLKNKPLLERLCIENQVTSKTPPTFIWHTITDELVPAQNSLLFIEACAKHNVSVEAHIYPHGGHGLALGTSETAWHKTGAMEQSVQSWMCLFTAWIHREFEHA